jgi:SPP1 gp7 family putative phage head morphogenesis protein
MLTAPPREKSLIPQQVIIAGLDGIEEPLVQAQTEILLAGKERLLSAALPMVKAKDTSAIASLSWPVAVHLQAPIYAVWSEGFGLGGEHMQAEVRAAIPRSDRARFSGVPENVERYALDLDVARLLAQFFELEPGQLMASAAQAAVLNRVIQLAGSFAQSQITDLKNHLIAAILPQPTTGDPISREELLKRIEGTLSVGRVRAENIARTELTNAYNRGRVAMGQRSTLVEAFRFIAIADARTTDICRSRDGMIIEAGDQAGLNGNTPALHFRCRSTLSPVMPRVNPTHQEWFEDSSRRRENRELALLLPGWS